MLSASAPLTIVKSKEVHKLLGLIDQYQMLYKIRINFFRVIAGGLIISISQFCRTLRSGFKTFNQVQSQGGPKD
jgi:phage anti-repressor protein